MDFIERNFSAYLDEMDIITVLLPLSYHHGLSSTFSITDESQKVRPIQIIKKQHIENNNKYICRLTEEISFGHPYWVVDAHGGKTELQIGAVIRTDKFDDRFFYDGNDLGVTYNASQTQFKLWAPTAVQVKLKLRQPNHSFSEIIKMRREEKGIWSIVVYADLELYQYSFLVLVNQEWRESVDPYAVAVTANGELGVIVNLEKTHRQKSELPPFDHPVNAIIYETHIRDFTIHPNTTVKHKGLYLGGAERNAKGTDGEPVGLSYVKNLGVTHIEFLPFNDFAGVDELNPNHEYNWGYNPIHYNVPEGSYSTNPSNPYSRINELKQLIDSIHSEGMRVIMDVVYNHVYIRETSSFEKVVPGYYFRHNELGFPSNGTGVGNDIASERKMVRKFILDSIRFWMEEYHIDGFRFDLMGILDIDTMREVRKTCDSIQEGTIIIGEGWNLNTPLPIEKKAIIRNQSKIPGIAQFNDKFRDSIKGNTFYLYDKGYIFGNEHYYGAAVEVISGSIGLEKGEHGLLTEPSQSVNYVECHDNHTLWDKLVSCRPNAAPFVQMKYHRLATGLVVLSQGIPFLHSGQEFFRTKQGDGNSYKSSDQINRLDWERKQRYIENVNYIKGLIQIRKEFSCFRMKSTKEIRGNTQILILPLPLIGYSLKNDSNDYETVLFIINPLEKQQFIQIPDGSWTILANDKMAGISSTLPVVEKELLIEPVCLTILAKK